MRYALLIGASSAIAKAMCRQLLSRQSMQLIQISSKPITCEQTHANLAHIECDYSESGIADALTNVHQYIDGQWHLLQHVVIFNGVLHNEHLQPEKRIEQVSGTGLSAQFTNNAITPFLFVAQLFGFLNHQCNTIITVFSARVGSISDNRLGGWYSYRSSKAALNMLLKTATIELARRAKHCQLIAFHPGTTDTALSKPFQHNVAKGRLFSAEFVAKSCLQVIESTPCDGQLHFLDWQGKHIDF